MELGWLFSAPVAHRGLHDRARGIIENTVSAAAAAVKRGFPIECDLQRTADGEAVVFHDFALERLSHGTGPVAALTATALGAVDLRDTSDRIPTLGAFLNGIAGAVPVVVEIKSAFDGDMRLADRAVEVVRGYGGPLAFKSFDPDIVRHLRNYAGLTDRGIPLGQLAETTYAHADWDHLSPERKRELAALVGFDESRPDFLSFRAADLPHAAANLCRRMLGMPVMAWTVRSLDEARHARRWADGIVFEGFDPTDGL